ncbi:MAG: hypothetical protein ACFFHV_21760 [Promethearchaeota archaeon]
MYWIEINEKNLIKFQKNLNWEGSGTKEDPIIIENLAGLKDLLRFKKIKSYIVIRNISLCELQIRHSANLTVQNCVVYYFMMEYCHNLLVEKSSIVHFDVEISNGNIFRNNNLHDRSGLNEYTLRTKGGKMSHLTASTYLLGAFLFLGFFFLIFYGVAILQHYEHSFIMLIGALEFLVFSGILVVPVIINKRKRNFLKKFPLNIFENNLKVDLGDLDKKYSAIYEI